MVFLVGTNGTLVATASKHREGAGMMIAAVAMRVGGIETATIALTEVVGTTVVTVAAAEEAMVGDRMDLAEVTGGMNAAADTTGGMTAAADMVDSMAPVEEEGRAADTVAASMALAEEEGGAPDMVAANMALAEEGGIISVVGDEMNSAMGRVAAVAVADSGAEVGEGEAAAVPLTGLRTLPPLRPPLLSRTVGQGQVSDPPRNRSSSLRIKVNSPRLRRGGQAISIRVLQ